MDVTVIWGLRGKGGSKEKGELEKCPLNQHIVTIGSPGDFPLVGENGLSVARELEEAYGEKEVQVRTDIWKRPLP